MFSYDPNMSLGRTIRLLREAAGYKTQVEFAEAVTAAGGKLSQPQLSAIEKDEVENPGSLYKIAEVLGTTTDALKRGDATVPEVEPKVTSQRLTSLDHNHPLLQKEKMRADVPLHGTTLVGAGDSFQMDGATAVSFRRPPGLDGRKDVFCIYVAGSSMEPRYSPGELLYLETIKPPRPGEFVVVEVSPAQPDAPKLAYLRMLVSDAAGKVKLRQMNPEKIYDIAREKILQIYRVMPWAEVMGV